MSTRCPKCRALGLSEDCAERLIHGRTGMTDEYELEVTMTFAVPVTSSLPLDPHEMATHMRETWISDETQLEKVLAESVYSDFALQVRPVDIT